MPVSYVGILNSVSRNVETTSYEVPVHSQEQYGHFKITALWLPTEVNTVTPSTSGWTFPVTGDTTAGNFKLWLGYKIVDAQSTEWQWDAQIRVWAAQSLILDGVDLDEPFQVGPVFSGASSGTSLSVPSMTPVEADNMACWWFVTRYSSSTSSKSIGTVSGLTMSNQLASGTSSAGHVIRFGRIADQPVGSPTGTRTASATNSPDGWRTMGGIIRAQRPPRPKNRQFHVLA